MKFGAISLKNDILSVTAELKFKSTNSFAHYVTHIIVTICSIQHFVLHQMPFPLLKMNHKVDRGLFFNW